MIISLVLQILPMFLNITLDYISINELLEIFPSFPKKAIYISKATYKSVHLYSNPH